MLWIFYALFNMALAAPSYNSTVVRCLALEEAQFHKNKRMGALYDLNQKLIGEITQLMNTDAQPEFKKKICMSRSPSWSLLEQIMLHPLEWWVIDPEVQKKQPHLTRELVNEINEYSFELFIQFLSALQIDAPVAGCLEKKVTELAPIFKKIKYLQEDIDPKDLVPAKNELQSIFRKINDPGTIYKVCLKEKKIFEKKKNQTKPRK